VLQIFTTVKGPGGHGHQLPPVGVLGQERGATAAAEPLYRRAVKNLREIGEQEGHGQRHGALGILAQNRGDYGGGGGGGKTRGGAPSLLPGALEIFEQSLRAVWAWLVGGVRGWWWRPGGWGVRFPHVGGGMFFVAYGHEDAGGAGAAGNLHRAGFDVVVDEWELVGGDRVTGRLEDGIRDS